MRLNAWNDQMLDDGIALVAAGGEHYRGPEGIHLGQMRLPVAGDGARKNRRELGIETNLGVKSIDELANAILGNMFEFRCGRVHVASITTRMPSTVQKRELTSMRTRSRCLARPRALQARFPGSRNGHATTSLIGTVLLIGVFLPQRSICDTPYKPGLAVKQYP